MYKMHPHSYPNSSSQLAVTILPKATLFLLRNTCYSFTVYTSSIFPEPKLSTSFQNYKHLHHSLCHAFPLHITGHRCGLVSMWFARVYVRVESCLGIMSIRTLYDQNPIGSYSIPVNMLLCLIQDVNLKGNQNKQKCQT